MLFRAKSLDPRLPTKIFILCAAAKKKPLYLYRGILYRHGVALGQANVPHDINKGLKIAVLTNKP